MIKKTGSIAAIWTTFQILLNIFCIVVALPLNAATTAENISMETTNPSTAGLVSPTPTWSVGLQAASLGNTGITSQKKAFLEGALNATFGLGYWAPVLSLDYLRFLTSDFKLIVLNSEKAVQSYRGVLLPFVAGGLQAGQGVGLRFSSGIQYTMLEDPVEFFSGGTILLGPCKCEPYLFKAGSLFLGINLGVRVLL